MNVLGDHDTIVLVGSHGLDAAGGTLRRKPSDWDFITTFDGLQTLTSRLRRFASRVESIPLSETKTVLRVHDGQYKGMVEVEIAWPGSTGEELIARVPERSKYFADCLARIPTIDQLYTLKLSHRYLKNSPHFLKTLDDVAYFRSIGAKVFDEGWLKRREAETYTYKHPKLNVMKGDFFKGDGVQYVYDHDDIHKAVAHVADHWLRLDDDGHPLPDHYEKVPAYTLYMKEGAQVQCDKNKFFALPEMVRLYGVLEEAYVLALERSQIPFRGKVEPRRSFDIALMKVCTSITSGWFREFAWENFRKVESMYEANYVDRFWTAVEAGRVRKFDAKTNG